ncbi:hypothetical protein K1719_046219 [Acacia pycnantha]|nr:hypothetical protein K1719_046219 [Acacia pycnantha]
MSERAKLLLESSEHNKTIEILSKHNRKINGLFLLVSTNRKPSIISYSSFLVQDFVRIFVYVKIDVVEKLIKEHPSVPTDWSNGDVNLAERNSMSNGISVQHVENRTSVRETQSMLLERIASEMNRLKFYVTHAKNLPFIENMEKRIQNASLIMDASLGHCFVDGLEHRDATAIYNCLRAYAAIDNTKNAEEIFRTTIVAPLLRKIIPHGPSAMGC